MYKIKKMKKMFGFENQKFNNCSNLNNIQSEYYMSY